MLPKALRRPVMARDSAARATGNTTAATGIARSNAGTATRATTTRDETAQSATSIATAAAAMRPRLRNALGGSSVEGMGTHSQEVRSGTHQLCPCVNRSAANAAQLAVLGERVARDHQPEATDSPPSSPNRAA